MTELDNFAFIHTANDNTFLMITKRSLELSIVLYMGCLIVHVVKTGIERWTVTTVKYELVCFRRHHIVRLPSRHHQFGVFGRVGIHTVGGVRPLRPRMQRRVLWAQHRHWLYRVDAGLQRERLERTEAGVQLQQSMRFSAHVTHDDVMLGAAPGRLPKHNLRLLWRWDVANATHFSTATILNICPKITK